MLSRYCRTCARLKFQKHCCPASCRINTAPYVRDTCGLVRMSWSWTVSARCFIHMRQPASAKATSGVKPTDRSESSENGTQTLVSQKRIYPQGLGRNSHVG